MLDETTQENGLEPISNNENQKPKEAEMPLSNIQKAKELKNNANLTHTQAEIPNIFSVWDECFSSARNYKNLMSKTNLDFLYTP